VPVDAQRLVTVADAARRLKRSTEQVRRYLREGRLTGQRFGGQWFIDRTELDAFQEHLEATTGFLESIPPASKLDPLASVIGIGQGGGANIAQGKNAYRRAFWWRRS
jgi:excisionase family DNA binding protein